MNNFKLIFAMSQNRVIGNNNKLPWYIPEDLERFKTLTAGGVVVMGRKTWDSLPARVKPLPNRTNIVLSRDLDLEIPGVSIGNCITDVIWQYSNSKTPVWFIGGKDVLEEAAEYADEIYLTYVLEDVKGDVFAPEIDLGKFDLVEQSDDLTNILDIRYRNLLYKRIQT